MLTKSENRPTANNIAMVVLTLMAIGTVFVFSAGANINQPFDLAKFYEFPVLRQIAFFPIACIILFSMACFDYKKLRLSAPWFKSPTVLLLILSIALLVIVLLPQLGTEINRARRWLRIPIGPARISFQPSELAKWTLLFFLAAYCDRYADSLKMFWKRFVPACVIIAITVGLIIVEDFGTTAFICLLAFLLLMIAGAKWQHLLTPVPFAAGAFFFAILLSPSRLQRISGFLNPDRWADSANYQATQSLIAIGSGGLWGKGLGMGICKYGHLPEDTTDFIFAIIGEELGLVGTMSVILLFSTFLCLGLFVIIRCRDRFGKLLASAIVLTIGIQAAINIGVVTVMLPTKGISLPFVSAGGTGLLLSAAAVGILMNIAKQSSTPQLENIE